MLIKSDGGTVELTVNKWIILFSYGNPVAAYSALEKKFFQTTKKWSPHTSKHLIKFLDMSEAEKKSQEWFDGLFSVLCTPTPASIVKERLC